MTFLNTTQEEFQNKLALCFNKTNITYAELENLISITHSNLNNKLKKDKIVAFSLPKSIEEIIITLTFLKNKIIGLNIGDDKPFDFCLSLLEQNGINYFYTNHDWRTELNNSSINYEIDFVNDNFLYSFCFPEKKSPLLSKASWSLLTSGSTKHSKIVLIDEENLKSRTNSEILSFNLNSNDKICNFLNLSHDLGLNQLLTAYHVKATLYLHKYIFLYDFYNFILENEITGFTAVANLWEECINKKNEISFAKSCLRYVTISGSRLSQQYEKTLPNLLPPNVTIYKTYGQTETFRSLIGIVGKNFYQGTALPNVQLELKNLDTSNSGELIHSGEGTMLGYIDDEIPRNKIMTGDIFKVHNFIEYQYIGRNDLQFKIKGQKFYPEYIESIVVDFDEITECLAYYTSTDNQEKITLIYKSKKSNLEKENLLQFLKSVLPKILIPSELIEIDVFPRLHSGKIDRLKTIEIVQSLRLNK